MAKPKVCDVFITHAEEDIASAKRVAQLCRTQGLTAITHAELSSAVDVGDAVWNALMESRALILLLSAGGLTPIMTVELGGAWGTSKPVYGIVSDPLATYEGPVMTKVMLYPKERVTDVIHAIKSGIREFSDLDRESLARLYSQFSATVDQLSTGSSELESLIEAFASSTGRRVDGDHLLSELLRMRKQGKLPRRRAARHSAS